MASNRSSSRASGPRGRTGPGRPSRPAPGRPARPVASAPTPRRRPRLTSRATILVAVLAVLLVSYASSARAYLQQRSELDALRAEIEQRESAIADLEREMRRWQDPAYVQQEARELGYVMPGETSYVVLDEDGEPLEAPSELADPDEVGDQEEPAFWEDAWASVVLAGKPPADDGTPPLTEIDPGTDGAPE